MNRAWKQAFHPEYAETDDYRPVTSHYGRHYFATYFRKDEQVSRELIQYMRGDVVGGNALGDRAAIDNYLHAYYEDIEGMYRSKIYKLRL